MKYKLRKAKGTLILSRARQPRVSRSSADSKPHRNQPFTTLKLRWSKPEQIIALPLSKEIFKASKRV